MPKTTNTTTNTSQRIRIGLFSFVATALLTTGIGVALLLLGTETETSTTTTTTSPFASLQPGTWYEVPNSHLETVFPNPIPPGISGAQAVMGAWSGGAFDTSRNRLIISGGGHGDYGGNELYAFDIGTLTWSRIWGPSTNIPQPGGAAVDTYSDGNPVSRHTYDALNYLPTQDRFWLNGGSRYSGSGSAGRDTWTFDLTNGAWEPKANLPVCEGCAYLESVSDYDPVTGHIFLTNAGNDFYEYDPVANTWTKRGNGSAGTFTSAAIDPVRRKFVIVGNGSVKTYDLAGANTQNPVTISTTGDTAMVGIHYPGIVYDPVADRLVAWSGGANVYSLNLDTNAWTLHAPAGGNTVTPTAAPTAGTYGRFQYIPSKNAYLAVNATNQNVYLYKLPVITRVDLPLKTWVSRPLPAQGLGPCPNGCKHMRIGHNPINGRLYFEGGRLQHERFHRLRAE